MKIQIKLLALSFASLALSCTKENSVDDCVKGKYLGNYCGQTVVQILDDTRIGQDWTSIYGDKFQNCVASPQLSQPFAIPADSIIYFMYKNGTSGRKDFMLCFPESLTYINILAIYSTPCLKTDN
ncbi:hypothetical protein [Dyadobacter sp. NIV53]|uniref:hypothetical protein n=1 Tax=Dyadobacter sp. NIV53 TaxID=2861765 RepID=UPI001C870BBA|nr:hypothetical protein [Dyadobacter sp. NIV53]